MINEKEAEKNFSETCKELEKGDVPAMVIAAFVTFMPYVLAVVALMFFLAWILS